MSTPVPERGGAFAAALDTLRSHQEQVRSELLTGFESRQDILLWQHRTGAMTIGRLSADWYKKILPDRWLTAALLNDMDKRESMCAGDAAPGDSLAKKKRLDIIQKDLMPAFQQALKVARAMATDYAEAVDKAPVGERQQFIFMRPQLDELYQKQRTALQWALGRTGTIDRELIRTREDLLNWADMIIYATNGFIDEGFVNRVAGPASEWNRPLLKSRGAMLELLLCTQVLPAMAEAQRDVAQRAQESPATESAKPDQPPL